MYAKRILTTLCTIGLATALCHGQTESQIPSQSELSSLAIFADAVDAYIYGYPMLMIAITERVATTTPTTAPNAGHAPLNQFAKATALPKAGFTDVVLPSTSTLYASAFLNLKLEPIVMHLPPIDRFFLMEMLDAWTNVSTSSPGTRQNSPPGDYIIGGPDWDGVIPPALPTNTPVIRMPTNTVWIIGRIFTSGTQADLEHVANDILPNITLKPLSKVNTDYMPPTDIPIDPSIDTKTPPLHQVANMDACAFYSTFAATLKTNPPLPQDTNMVRRLANINVVPGNSFDCSEDASDPTTRAVLQLAVQVAKTKLADATVAIPPTSTHWLMPLNVGDYGRRYLLRAIVAEQALGANLPADAVYGYTGKDNGNNAVKGTNTYKIHFNPETSRHLAGEIPPVNPKAFWSVTIYKADGTLLDTEGVDYNAIGWSALGPTIQGHSFCYNSDKSLDIYLQATRPSGAIESCNWLPIPTSGGATVNDADFIVFLRMYWPDQVVLHRRWIPPAVTKTN